MNRSLYIAKTGLDAQQFKLDTTANNLANVSTTGFKRARPGFQDLMYQNIRQPGAQSSIQTELPSGLQIGTGVSNASTERLHTQGNIEKTGNSKDVAIEGRGFLVVQMPDGTDAYTRDGALQLDRNGQLVTADGNPISPAIVIPENALSVEISKDGIVSVTQPGNDEPAQVGQLQLTTFVNPAGLESIGDNLYRETQASGPRNDNIPGDNGAGWLRQNYLETSNVNVVEEMVTMIETQRAYELNSKSVETSDQMLRRLTQL